MVSYVYILYSKSLDQYYIGSTILSIESRLDRHIESYYGNKKFTSKAKDWIIFHSIKCAQKEQSQNIERHIKRMKSRKYIENLKVYPEITIRLLEKHR